jgi:hypothetical protein
MHVPIYGYPVAYGVIAFAAGLGLWHYCSKSAIAHRAAMVAFGLAFAFFAIGVIPFQDALAGLTSTGTGLVVLVVVFLLAVAATAYELRHKRKDKRLYAHACAGVAFIAMVMIIGNGVRLLSEAARSPARSATALAQSVHGIQSGAAAHAQSSHQSMADVGLAIAALAVLVVLGRRHERKRSAPASRGQLAITGGRPGAGGTPPPLPRGH